MRKVDDGSADSETARVFVMPMMFPILTSTGSVLVCQNFP